MIPNVGTLLMSILFRLPLWASVAITVVRKVYDMVFGCKYKQYFLFLSTFRDFFLKGMKKNTTKNNGIGLFLSERCARVFTASAFAI